MDTENQKMQQFQPDESEVEPSRTTLELTKQIQKQLGETGQWSKFLAILGFIFLGVLILFGIIMSIAMAFIPKTMMPGIPFPPFLIGLFYLITAGIYFFPLLYLYRFSSGIKQALQLKNQDSLASAFFNLKAHYRFIGILMIISLVLYVLMFIGFIIAGFVGGLSGLGGMQV